MKIAIIAFVLLSTFSPTLTKSALLASVDTTHAVVEKTVGLLFHATQASERQENIMNEDFNPELWEQEEQDFLDSLSYGDEESFYQPSSEI